MSFTFKMPDITPARDSGEGSKMIMTFFFFNSF